MAVVSLVFFSLLPFFVWFLYCLSRKHVSLIHLFFFPLAASFAVAVSVGLRFILEPFVSFVPVSLAPVFIALVVTAVPEELAKILFVVPFARTGPERSPVTDITLCARAVCLALAFVSLENIVFASRYPSALVLRMGTAVPFHGAVTLFSALWLSRRISLRRSGSREPAGSCEPAGSREPAPRFLLSGAIVFHGFYAWGFVQSPPIPVFSALVAVMAVLRAVYLWKRCGSVGHGS